MNKKSFLMRYLSLKSTPVSTWVPLISEPITLSIGSGASNSKKVLFSGLPENILQIRLTISNKANVNILRFSTTTGGTSEVTNFTVPYNKTIIQPRTNYEFFEFVSPTSNSKTNYGRLYYNPQDNTISFQDIHNTGAAYNTCYIEVSSLEVTTDPDAE